MKRLRYSYCGDFGIKSFCQSNPMVDGFLRQLGSVGRDQDMLVHLAPPSNFLNVQAARRPINAAVLATAAPCPLVETVAISIVFGALTDPRTNGISVADRQLLLAVRHAHLRGGAPIEEPHQVTAFRITRDDHRAELCALHQPFVGREIEPAFFVARAAGLVAAHTSAFENRQYVFGEALRFCRAQLSRGRGHVDNHEASGANYYRGCYQVSSFHVLRSEIDLRRR